MTNDKTNDKPGAIPAEPAETFNRIGRGVFMLGILKDPEKALTFYNSADDTGRELLKSAMKAFENFCNYEARRTGETARNVWLDYMQDYEKTYSESIYNSALTALDSYVAKYQNTADEPGVKELAALYYLAKLDINPTEPGELTAKQKKELRALTARLDDYFLSENSNDNGGTVGALYRFIEIQSIDIDEKKVIARRIKDITYPTEKANKVLFYMQPGKEETLKAESDEDGEKGKLANVYLFYDFEPQGTSRPLTRYDKRIFVAVSNLGYQGYKAVTAAQVYWAMGNTGKLNEKNRKKILECLKSLMRCTVTIDCTEEARLYPKYNGGKVIHTFNLLDISIYEKYQHSQSVNGMEINDAIVIKDVPELFKRALMRGQCETIPIKALQTSLRQTEDTLTLEDYLLPRICHMMKRGEKVNNILLDTICEKCGITERYQRSRAFSKDGKVVQLLETYKHAGLIKGYELTDRDIKIKPQHRRK